MDNVISAVQGGTYHHQRVFDGTVLALEWLLLSLLGDLKDSVRMKKLVAGEGYRACVKEVLEWILETEAGTVNLPENNLKELLTLVDIPENHCMMG